MAKMNEVAKNYEPPKTTKNIADLNEVSTDVEMLEDEFEFEDKATKRMKTVKQQVININGENYRVPVSVIQQLKIILGTA